MPRPKSWLDLSLRLAQSDQEVAALGRITARLAPQLECLAEPAQGLVGRELIERALARPARVVDGLRGLVRRRRAAPVMGQLGDPIARVVPAHLLERLPDPGMEPGAPRPAQVLVEGVIDQRVREGEAPDRTRLVDHRSSRGLLEQVEQRVLVGLEHACEEIDVEVAADHRGHGKRLAARLAQPLHTPADDLADALGQSEVPLDGEPQGEARRS